MKITAIGIYYRLADRIRELGSPVSTCGRVEVDRLGIPRYRQATARRYQATPYRVLDRIFARLARHLDPSRETLVDWGCGKGRVLVEARQAGFARAIGVELSPALADRAFRNLGAGGEIVRADASAYVPPEDARVHFLFNPFTEPVLRIVANRIGRVPGAWCVLVNPIRERVLLSAGFELADEIPSRDSNYIARVYRN